MSMIERLKQEHYEVFVLFVRLRQTKNYYIGEREHLFNLLKDKLILLSGLEEKILYSKLGINDESEEIIKDLVNKNIKIKNLIGEISQIPIDSLGWLTRVAGLLTEFESHVEKEEALLFNTLTEVLNKEQNSKLENRFQDEKVEALKQVSLK